MRDTEINNILTKNLVCKSYSFIFVLSRKEKLSKPIQLFEGWIEFPEIKLSIKKPVNVTRLCLLKLK